MSDFITSLLANMAESAIDAAAARRRAAQTNPPSPIVRRPSPVAMQPWKPPVLEPNVVLAAVEPPPARPAAPRKAAEPAVAAPPPRAPGPALRLFASPSSVLHAVVASEALAPPLALREDNLWSRRGV